MRASSPALPGRSAGVRESTTLRQALASPAAAARGCRLSDRPRASASVQRRLHDSITGSRLVKSQPNAFISLQPLAARFRSSYEQRCQGGAFGKWQPRTFPPAWAPARHRACSVFAHQASSFLSMHKTKFSQHSERRARINRRRHSHRRRRTGEVTAARFHFPPAAGAILSKIYWFREVRLRDRINLISRINLGLEILSILLSTLAR